MHLPQCYGTKRLHIHAPCCKAVLSLYILSFAFLQVSAEHVVGRLLVIPQHRLPGTEQFNFQIQSANRLSLYAVPPMPVAPGPSTAAVPVACDGAEVVCGPHCKPSTLHVEVASGKDSLLITAHGHLLGVENSHGMRRVCSVLQPALGLDANPRSALASNTWVIQHHGGCTYSFCAAQTGQHMYVDDSGAAVVGDALFPDHRVLFHMELCWFALPPYPTAPVLAAVTPAAKQEAEGSWAADASQFVSSPPQQGPAADFAKLELGEVALGFSLRTHRKVRGRHLYLSAQPDGLITTVYSSGLTRWELFMPVDLKVGYTTCAFSRRMSLPAPTVSFNMRHPMYHVFLVQAVLDSSLKPLTALPTAPPVAQPGNNMHRSTSMQHMRVPMTATLSGAADSAPMLGGSGRIPSASIPMRAATIPIPMQRLGSPFGGTTHNMLRAGSAPSMPSVLESAESDQWDDDESVDDSSSCTVPTSCASSFDSMSPLRKSLWDGRASSVPVATRRCFSEPSLQVRVAYKCGVAMQLCTSPSQSLDYDRWQVIFPVWTTLQCSTLCFHWHFAGFHPTTAGNPPHPTLSSRASHSSAATERVGAALSGATARCCMRCAVRGDFEAAGEEWACRSAGPSPGRAGGSGAQVSITSAWADWHAAACSSARQLCGLRCKVQPCPCGLF
jgi:hypothetical protein